MLVMSVDGIEIRNLTKTYTAKDIATVTAIDDMSVVLPFNKMVFITGKSGSGKSSLLNILGLIDGFDSGEILIGGAPVSKFTSAEKNFYRSKKIGFIFQEYNIIEKYSIGQNIALSLDISGDDKDERAKVEKALEQVGLAGFYKRKSNQISGGQKQRVAIARAIIKNPDIILADEPTGALDTVTGAEIFKILKELSKEKTVIVVSHDIESARKWGDIIYQMRDGKIVHTEEGGNITETVMADADGVFDAAAVRKHIKSGRSVTIRAHRKPEKAKRTVLGNSAQKAQDLPNGAQGSESPNARIQPIVKSRMSAHQTFKIAGMAMFAGKARFGITLLLCSLVLALFGFSLMFGAFDTKKMVVNEVRNNGTPFITVRPWLEDGTDMLGGINFANTSYKQLAYDILDANDVKYLKKNNLSFSQNVLADALGLPAGRPNYIISGTKYSPVVSSFMGTAEFYKGFDKDLGRMGITITGDMDKFNGELERVNYDGGDYCVVPVLITGYHFEIMKLWSRRADFSADDIIGKYVNYFAATSNVSFLYQVTGIINYDLSVFDSVMKIQKKENRSSQTKEENRADYMEIQKLNEQLESYMNYVYVADGVFNKIQGGFFSSASSIYMSALPFYTKPIDGATFEVWDRWLSYLALAPNAAQTLSFTEYYAIVKELGTTDNNLIASLTTAEEEEEEEEKWSPVIPGSNAFAGDVIAQNPLVALDDNLFGYDFIAPVTDAGLDTFLTDYTANAYSRVVDTSQYKLSSGYSVLYSSYGYAHREASSASVKDGKLSTMFSFIQQENAGVNDVPIANVNALVPDAEFDHDKDSEYITLVLDFGSVKEINAAALWHLVGFDDAQDDGGYSAYIPTVTGLPDCYPLEHNGTNNNWKKIDWTAEEGKGDNTGTFGDVTFCGLSAIMKMFAPVSTQYLALVIHNGSDDYLNGNEIQISFTDGTGDARSYIAGTDYNLAGTHISGITAGLIITAPDVGANTFADINNTQDGVILSWSALTALMPSQFWSSYYYSQYFQPDEDNPYNIANIIWYLMENNILGKTVYMQQFILNGADNYSAVLDIPVKVLGVSVPLMGLTVSYTTKHLTERMYNGRMAYSSNYADDILIPYTNRAEIEKLYDKFKTDEFISYIKPYEKMTGSNVFEMFTSIQNNPIEFWASGDGGDTNKRYILTINGTTINPIYSIDKIFGLFNEIFKVIAIVLIVIMVILLWSFMSFTIKTRTKDIGILISLGASRHDLANIFIIEGGLIALGQVFFSIIAAFVAKHFVRDYMVQKMGDVIKGYDILALGIWQITAMVLIAIGVTAFATAIPLWGLARKQPVEIIRKIET
jgi:ABC-type lipoprotein export system ATPase subunit/ABC-type antimicrobial peptide transport system permease subunit